MIVLKTYCKKILFILNFFAFFFSLQVFSWGHEVLDIIPRSPMAKKKKVTFFRAKEDKQTIKNHIASILHSHRTGLRNDRERELADFIYKECKVNGVDPFLILALIKTESSFYNWSIGHRGARGLMQILPFQGKALAEELDLKWEGHKTLFVPEKNIKMGAYYFGKLSRQFKDITLALTAYNWGPTRVLNLLQVGRNPRRKFPKTVLAHYERFKNLPGIKSIQIGDIEPLSPPKQQRMQ